MKWIARRTIEKGDVVMLPLTVTSISPDVVAVLEDESDAELLLRDATVIDVPHPDVDVQIIATGDVTPDEAVAMVREATHSPTRETVMVPIPPSVRTVGDFFDQMGEQFAETMWSRGARVCTKCGVEKMFVDSYGVCPDCLR